MSDEWDARQAAFEALRADRDRYREALEEIVEPANADQTSAEYSSWVFKVATQALSPNPSETGAE